MMKIAVIDSGINLEYEDFKDVSIETIGIGKAYKYIKDKNGHGASTIGEIVNINPKAEIIVFKALDENKRCSLLTVINILKYCMSRNDISIINMSLSCVIYDEEVFKYGSRIIKKLLNKKIKIVASVANNMDYIHNERNFPSDVEGVIKVKHIYSPKQYIEFDRRNMIYTYYGSYNLMPTKNNNYLFYKGNSSFTARISGFVSLLGGLCQILSPIVMQKILDEGILSKSMYSILVWCGAILGLEITNCFLQYLYVASNCKIKKRYMNNEESVQHDSILIDKYYIINNSLSSIMYTLTEIFIWGIGGYKVCN